MTINKVIPGRVLNDGIVSGEDLPAVQPIISSPAHFPDFAMVTARGPVKRATVGTGGFNAKFGATLGANSPFYNPIALGISKISAAGQASFSFKRLTANEEYARVTVGVVVFKGQQVPNYERNGDGSYKLDLTGQPVVDATTPKVPGVFVCPVILKSTIDTPFGSAKKLTIEAPAGLLVPADTEGDFYPLFELKSGIGNEYNSMYATVGHSVTTDWGDVATFIRDNGAFPFILNLGELLHSGQRVPAATVNGSLNVLFSLYPVQDDNEVRYGLPAAIGNFTGENVNRPVEVRPAPFDTAHVYEQYLNEVCGILFDAEHTTGGQEAPIVRTNRMPAQAVMNPLSLVNQNGHHYHHVVFGGNLDTADKKLKGTRISLNHYLQANGGIFPFADKDGKYPAAPDSWDEAKDGVWVTDLTSPIVVTHKQYWEMNQILLQGWLVSYRNSLDLQDVIRNRTSFLWDVGYNEAIKEELIQFLGKRKDLMVMLCATEYLVDKSIDQIYSTMQALNAKITSIPESEEYQTPTCRSSINLWDALVINEPLVNRYSLNIENMYAFAWAGGGQDGRIIASRMPDHEGNRTLRITHKPKVEFEADDPAANNLIAGAVTVTPLNVDQYCRPAYPTVYPITDEVLKDVPNVWKCIVAEKILQDLWIQVSGDSQIGRDGYVSFMKDNGETRIRELMGSVLGGWEVEPYFREDQPNSKSILYTRTHLWMGKAIYMMKSVLVSYNEDTLNTETAA